MMIGSIGFSRPPRRARAMRIVRPLQAGQQVAAVLLMDKRRSRDNGRIEFIGKFKVAQGVTPVIVSQ